MGRVNDAPDVVNQPQSMKHFSHPHELELCNPQNLPNTNQCSACKLQSSGIMHICRPCNFTLHFTCSQFPQLITHTCHPNHTLTLLPTSSYPGGKFNCDACNHQGDGFSYHCHLCEFDLHVICASKPHKINHHLHPCQLELTFQNPYKNSTGFSCDVCSKMGSKQWLYRCSRCEFDVHLDCANATTAHTTTLQAQPMIQRADSFPGRPNLHNGFQVPLGAAQGVGSVRPNHYTHAASMGALPQNQKLFQNQPPSAAGQIYGSVRPTQFMHIASMGSTGNYQPPIGNQFTHSASMGSLPNYQPPIGNQFTNSASMGPMPNYQPPTVQNYQASRTDSLMNAAVQGLVEGAAQTVGQTLIQSIIGGGGGGPGGDGNDGSGSISLDSSSDAQNY